MKRFVFSLEQVLRVKRRREWLAEQAQRQAAAALDAARGEVAALCRQLDQAAAAAACAIGQPLDTTAWLAAQWLAARLGQELVAAEKKAEEAAHAFQHAADRRRAIASEVEALVTLRDRQWQEWRQDMARRHQDDLDDLGLRRWQAARQAEGEETGGTSPCARS